MERDDAILDYLQDRLSAEDRRAFEASMAQDAALAAEVDLMRAVRAEMAAGPVHAQADQVWDRLAGAMDTAVPPANDNRPPWRQALRYAAVAVLAVGAWQVAVVPRLVEAPDGFRTATEQPAAALVLQVKFVDSATIAEIGALLGPLGGTISDGPGALGVVLVAFPEAAARDAGRAALAARSDLVELVLDP